MLSNIYSCTKKKRPARPLIGQLFMLFIRFGRYVATPDVIKNKKGLNCNVFKSILDSEMSTIDAQCSLERALLLARGWLNTSYGFVMIELTNQDESDSAIKIRLCNYKKFIDDMHKCYIEVKLTNKINFENVDKIFTLRT